MNLFCEHKSLGWRCGRPVMAGTRFCIRHQELPVRSGGQTQTYVYDDTPVFVPVVIDNVVGSTVDTGSIADVVIPDGSGFSGFGGGESGGAGSGGNWDNPTPVDPGPSADTGSSYDSGSGGGSGDF